MPTAKAIIGLKIDHLPDDTSMLNSRHLLKHHNLGNPLCKEMNKYLDQNGLMQREDNKIKSICNITAPSYDFSCIVYFKFISFLLKTTRFISAPYFGQF